MGLVTILGSPMDKAISGAALFLFWTTDGPECIFGTPKGDKMLQMDGQSYQTLNSIIAACPHAIIAVDFQKNVRIWNPAAERMFGWHAAEVVGSHVPFVT